jgi:hypothetical protein
LQIKVQQLLQLTYFHGNVESLSEKINVSIIPVSFNDANDTKSEEIPWIFTVEVSGLKKTLTQGQHPMWSTISG